MADPVQTLLDILSAAAGLDAMQAQQMLLRRLAVQGDVIPSRIPAPRNISEVGGYLNLLTTLNQTELRAQVLASVLGVAGPNPPVGWFPSAAPLSFVTVANDRPNVASAAAIPLTYTLRSDFATPFAAAMNTVHAASALVPFVTPSRTLPPDNPPLAADYDMLDALGRTLAIVPSAGLVDAAADPVAVAIPNPAPVAAALDVMAAITDPAAPTSNWDATTFDPAAGLQTTTVTRAFLPLSPIFNAAGWYRLAPPPPAPPLETFWFRWINVTGLVAGTTRFGDELALLYDPLQIAASPLRDRLTWKWNGSAFAP